MISSAEERKSEDSTAIAEACRIAVGKANVPGGSGCARLLGDMQYVLGAVGEQKCKAIAPDAPAHAFMFFAIGLIGAAFT